MLYPLTCSWHQKNETTNLKCCKMSLIESLSNGKARLKLFFKVMNGQRPGILKGSLAFLQYFKFVNWWIRGFVFNVTNRLSTRQRNYRRALVSHRTTGAFKSGYLASIISVKESGYALARGNLRPRARFYKTDCTRRSKFLTHALIFYHCRLRVQINLIITFKAILAPSVPKL